VPEVGEIKGATVFTGADTTFGVTEPDEADVPDVPLAFVALMVNVYAWFAAYDPVTATGLDVPL
jgi:hypothetical protein